MRQPPRPMSDDILELILDDHERFRRSFAELDELAVKNDPAELSEIWDPLAALLDVHAIAEEEIFYPRLLRESDDAEDETLDAIGDHNDIRDGIREAERQPVGGPAWWEAVRKTRLANDEHLAEEERDALADFRKHASIELRQRLGRQFREFKAAHPDPRRLDTSDKDPEGYVEAVVEEQRSDREAL
jgi:hypothetical protein